MARPVRAPRQHVQKSLVQESVKFERRTRSPGFFGSRMVAGSVVRGRPPVRWLMSLRLTPGEWGWGLDGMKRAAFASCSLPCF